MIFIAQKSEPKMSFNKIGGLLVKGGMFDAMALLTRLMAAALFDGKKDESKNESAEEPK
jgi:hypothetical protein